MSQTSTQRTRSGRLPLGGAAIGATGFFVGLCIVALVVVVLPAAFVMHRRPQLVPSVAPGAARQARS